MNEPLLKIDSRSMRPETNLFPRVTVIVPISGAGANLEKHLRSLLLQDYPAYAVIFVTQDEHDSAVPIIEQVIAGEKKGQRISAGKALACSQKNHNLVQGVFASDEATDILAFCDSGHYAHPKWLERLINPLQVFPYAAVSSGYHHVFPEETCICSIGRAICVLALYLARKIPVFAQPWGGATALRMIDFKKLGVAELWSTTIVDDVTLADHLQKKRMTLAIPTDADMKTIVSDCSLQAWESWLIRQWAFLKFLFPKLWFFAGLAGTFFSLLVYLCIVVLLSWGLEVFPVHYEYSAAVFLAVQTIGLLFFRMQHPSPGSLIFWYPAFLAALFMACWCHLRTWFADSITWAGITYKVAFGGKVVKIVRSNESAMLEKGQ
jgi:ceramide glucosyltransferase